MNPNRITDSVRSSIIHSIRLQLIFSFCVCVLSAALIYAVVNVLIGELNRSPVLDYQQGIEAIDLQARQIASYIATPDVSYQGISDYIDRNASFSGNNVLLVDLNGNVFFQTEGSSIIQVDLHSIISQSLEVRYANLYGAEEFTSFYPIMLGEQDAYLIVTGIPQPSISYQRGSSPFTLMIAIFSFVLMFFLLTNRKMSYLEELARGLLEVSKGNLNYRVPVRSRDELGSLASNINQMTSSLQETREVERRADRVKNELITNVSHDLRTPLTLIMGYLRLLKDKQYGTSMQHDDYIQIAYNKSEKLKVLIDDLFEYTKLSSQAEHLNLESICMNELMEQLIEELVGFAEENELQLVRHIPGKKIFSLIDPPKMIRVFENLLSNAIKYSHRPGTIEIILEDTLEGARICITNRGEAIPEESLPHIFERFFRVDKSRSSSSGGSGLGLAIAKSIVEAHQGSIWAECEGDAIRFCVLIPTVSLLLPQQAK